MIFSAKFDELKAALDAVAPAVKDNTLNESNKLIYFFLENKDKSTENGDNANTNENMYTLGVYSQNSTVICKSHLNITLAECSDNELKHFCFSSKKLAQWLDGMAGQNITVLSHITFDVRPECVYLIMHEQLQPKTFDDTPEEVKEKYNSLFNGQISKYRITNEKMFEGAKNRLSEINTGGVENFEAIDATEFKNFISSLIPIINPLKDGKYSRICFFPDLVYVAPMSYVTAIANTLPTVLSGFVLDKSAAQFLNDFCSLEDAKTECFVKKELVGNGVILYFKTNRTLVKVVAFNTFGAFNIATLKTVPDTGLLTSRSYFCDVLKRMVKAGSEITVRVDVPAEGASKASLIVENDVMHQTLPIVNTKGQGTFAFILNPNTVSTALLSTSIFTSNSESEYIHFFLGEDGRGLTSLFITDGSVPSSEPTSPEWQTLPAGIRKHLWFSHIGGLAKAKGFSPWAEKAGKREEK